MCEKMSGCGVCHVKCEPDMFRTQSNTLLSYVCSCVTLKTDHHPIALLISTEQVYRVHLTADLVVNFIIIILFFFDNRVSCSIIYEIRQSLAL